MNFLNYTIRRAAAGEVIKQSRQLRKGGCLSSLTKIFVFLLIILLAVWLIIYLFTRPEETKSVWGRVVSGDSIFVRSTYGIDFYRKGRKALTDSQKKATHYTREDTAEFFRINSIASETFYRGRSSFIGIYIGKDSTITKYGDSNSHRWLKVFPAQNFTDKKEWSNSRRDILSASELSKDWYVMASEVTLINTDSLFLKLQ